MEWGRDRRKQFPQKWLNEKGEGRSEEKKETLGVGFGLWAVEKKRERKNSGIVFSHGKQGLREGRQWDNRGRVG